MQRTNLKMNSGKEQKMVILHVANLTEDKSKGPNINVPQNVLYGNKVANVGVYNLCGNRLAIGVPEDKIFSIKEFSHIEKLPHPFDRPDIVIFQGLYYIKYCKIAKWLQDKKVPYVIVPRCSMTTAAIRSHLLKKKTAGFLFFNRFVSNADAVQFLTKNEYKESKNNFRFKRYYILGNGVELPKKHYTVKNRKEFKVVFIGRYNVYHKGLDILLDTIRDHEQWFKENNVLFLLYGSDSDNGLRYLRKTIDDNHLGGIVSICGPVFGEKKERALLDADVFIHTSRLEGQPTSVIEAVSYGVPVIVTPGTNVSDIVESKKLGYVAGLTSDSIFNSVRTAFLGKSECSDISSNELLFSKKCLDWDSIIKESIRHYTRVFCDSVEKKED